MAAQKFTSIMNFSSPIYSWPAYTKLIDEKAAELVEQNYQEAVWELKKFKRAVGHVPDCSEAELKQRTVDVAASFDCSWSSQGWSARDGVVAAVSEETGKVLDAVFMSKECPDCTLMEDKRSKGGFSHIEFLEWYLKHEPNCRLNHEGSSQVIINTTNP